VGFLTEIGFRWRKVLGLLMVIAMLFGITQYFTMPAREDPILVIRNTVVVANHPGLSAERMENLVARPLEEEIRTIPQIKEIKTTILEGQVIIQPEVYFEYSELDQIWDELREAVEDARPNLPDTMGPIIVNDDFGDVAVITAALTSDAYTLEELYDFAQYARDGLVSVPGTRRVDILGERTEQIYVEIRNAELSAAGVSVTDISRALQSQNIILSGGNIVLDERRFLIEPSGEFQTVSAIKDILIRPSAPSGADIIRLSDVANVARGYADPEERAAYYNGAPAIVVSVVMQPNQSAINYSEDAKAKFDEITNSLPLGVNFDIITFQADQVKSAVYGVSKNVLQTLVIVLVVVVIFLGLRTGLVVGSIVPIVILVTIAVMAVVGIPLQRMSLVTLIISLGLLVDNGIVVAEDYKRRLGDGVERRKAMSETGAELALPLLSSSLTTMVFFLPLALAAGGSGEYTRSISQVIIIALSISWLVSVTVTPTLCYYFVNTPREAEGKEPRFVQKVFNRLEDRYKSVLESVLRWRWAFLCGVIVAFMVGGWSIGLVKNQFFPSSDREQMLVYLDLPEGVSTNDTDEAMQIIMDRLSNTERYPDVENFAGYVGFGGPRFVLSLEPVDPGANVGFVVINMDGLDTLDANVAKLQDELNTALPDAFIRVTRMFLGPSDPNTIQIQVKGPDAQHLTEVAADITDVLYTIEGRQYVWTDWYNPVNRLVIDIDQSQARQVGLSSLDISTALATLTSGQTVTRFNEGDEKIPVTIRATDDERESVEFLSNFLIYPQGVGAGVPLSQIADIEVMPGYGRIQRENLERTITVEGRNVNIGPEDLVPMITPRLDEIRATLKPGHTIEFDGTIIESAEGQQGIAANGPLALALILLLLLAQFNSFRAVAIVMSIIPLSIIGAGLGLNVMNAPFGFVVILGLFALFGIIVNNAIVLIDRIRVESLDNPEERYSAVVSASVRRLRPILMATITTILGLMPLILTNDVLFYGFSVVVTFGLAVGTILTLGVVPILYCLFYRVEIPKAKDGSAKSAKQTEVPA